MSQEFHYSAVSVSPSQQEGLASCVHVCVCSKRDLIHGGTPLLYLTGRCIVISTDR